MEPNRPSGNGPKDVTRFKALPIDGTFRSYESFGDFVRSPTEANQCDRLGGPKTIGVFEGGLQELGYRLGAAALDVLDEREQGPFFVPSGEAGLERYSGAVERGLPFGTYSLESTWAP